MAKLLGLKFKKAKQDGEKIYIIYLDGMIIGDFTSWDGLWQPNFIHKFDSNIDGFNIDSNTDVQMLKADCRKNINTLRKEALGILPAWYKIRMKDE